MKTLFFLCGTLTLLIFAGDCRAQRLHGEDIPRALQETFTVMYPDLRLLYWEKEGENYSAKFKSGKSPGAMLFDRDANLLETETEIPVEELPKAVNSAGQKLLAEQKIIGAGKIIDNHERTIYKVKSDIQGLVIDPSGKLIRKYKID